MEKVKNIEKFVKQKSTQGYEGYLDTLVYFRQFDDKQLDFIETYEKAGLVAFNSLLKILEILPLAVAMIAVLVEVIPDSFFENADALADVVWSIFRAIIILLGIFYLVDALHTKMTYRKQYVLEVIQKVRKYREQGGSEYNVNVKSEETGELLSYHIKFLND